MCRPNNQGIVRINHPPMPYISDNQSIVLTCSERETCKKAMQITSKYDKSQFFKVKFLEWIYRVRID